MIPEIKAIKCEQPNHMWSKIITNIITNLAANSNFNENIPYRRFILNKHL